MDGGEKKNVCWSNDSFNTQGAPSMGNCNAIQEVAKVRTIQIRVLKELPAQ